MYVFAIAWRYARSRWINSLAVLAVAFALMTQIVVMAVLDGQIQDMKLRVRNLGEQVTITFSGNMPTRSEFNMAQRDLVTMEGVKGVTPLMRGYGILDHSGVSDAVLIYGIDLAQEAKYSELPKHLMNVTLDKENPDWRRPEETTVSGSGILVGGRLAKYLSITAGDSVHLSASDGRGKMESIGLEVTSTFISGDTFIKDSHAVYVPIELAQELLLGSYPEEERNRIQKFSIWLDDPEQADLMQDAIMERASLYLNKPGRYASVTNWKEQWSFVVQGMAHENALQELLMVLMNLSGGFCVFAIMATLVSRRIRDVGLLRCLGASRSGMISVFLIVGLLLGTAGALLGTGAALFLTSQTTIKQKDGRTREAPRIDAYFEILSGQPLYPPRMFGVQGAKGLPILLDARKILFYALGAILIAVLAAAYPAYRAGAQEPVEALQYE